MTFVGNELKKIGLKAAYNYLDKDPEQNLPRLMEWVDKHIGEDVLVLQRDVFREIIKERNSHWYALLESLWTDIDDDVRKNIFENLIINANALSLPVERENSKKYDCNIPWAMVLDVESQSGGNMSFDQWDDCIEQANKLGTYMFVFGGGEPLENPEEVIALCNKHDDCQFMMFTNGKAIDEELAVQLLRVKNLIPAIKIEKAEDKIPKRAAFILKSHKLPFGFYCNYNEDNQQNFAQEAFFEWIIQMGGKFFFQFSLLDEEEDLVYPVVRKCRESKPLLSINFCKDKNITGGCIAGGKYYCYVDATGNVKPCPFVNSTDSNLKTKSLLRACQSPLFMDYHKGIVDCNVCQAKKQ